MRITNNMISSQLTANINAAASRLFRQQRQIASAKRIDVPSDDPLGASLAISLRTALAQLLQAQRNGDAAEARLQVSDGLLGGIQAAMGRVKDLALQGSSDTLTGTERQALAGEVNQMLEQVFAAANGSSIDGYLFGGTQTTVAPFTATRDLNGNIIAVSANPLGINGQVKADLPGGVTMVVNVPGSDVFSKPVGAFSGIFPMLINVRDQLNTGTAASVGATLTDLDQALDVVRGVITDVSSRIARIQELQQGAESDLVVLKARLSQTEDTDLAGASIEFQQAQNVYQAALAAASRVLQTSLLDFLK